MKIAILSDIHGILAGWQAVFADLTAWGPDRVIVNGDMVNRGPQSFAVWQLVQKQAETAGWTVLRGNHERYVFSREWERPGLNHLGVEIRRQTAWTFRQHQGHVAELAALPTGCTLQSPHGGRLVRVRHAVMWSDEVGLYPDTGDEQIRGEYHTSTGRFCHRAYAPPVYASGGRDAGREQRVGGSTVGW
jgi:3',5'-cyclic AMP phosphodiesterase CpdA